MTDLCPTCGHPLAPDLRSLRLDYEARAVVIDDQVRLFTGRQFDLLAALIDATPRPCSKERLHRILYSLDPNGGAELKIVDVFVCKIRKELLGTRLKIETVWGAGYRAILEEPIS